MKLIIAFVIIVIGFNTFHLTPLGVYSKIFILGISVFGFIVNFKVILKIVWFKVIGIITLISMLSAYVNFNQSFLSSLIANSNLINGFALSFVFIWVKQGKVNFFTLLKWVITFTWLYSIVLFFMSFYDVNFEVISQVDGRVDYRGANKLSKHLIFLVIFFYFDLFRRLKKYKYLCYCLWFLVVTQFYDIQRGDIIFLVAVITIFSLINSKFKGIALFGLSFLGIVSLSVLNYTFSDSLVGEKFVQMGYFFQPDKWKLITDSSVGARLNEIRFALSYIFESPFFGNGLIRSSNYSSYFGDEYFYIHDIGLFGIYFSFGLVGLIYYIFTVVKAFGLQQVVVRDKINVFGLNLFLLFFTLYSIKSGVSVYLPFIMLFCFFSINFISDYEKPKT